jgi:hypothetical protein
MIACLLVCVLGLIGLGVAPSRLTDAAKYAVRHVQAEQSAPALQAGFKP